MPNILGGLGLEGSVLDGLAEWPASTIRKEWFVITRQLIQQTIADMDLEPAALAEVEAVVNRKEQSKTGCLSWYPKRYSSSPRRGRSCPKHVNTGHAHASRQSS